MQNKSSEPLSPFHWKQRTTRSIFARDNDFNGINTRRSEQQQGVVKNDLFDIGSRQMPVYTKARKHPQ